MQFNLDKIKEITADFFDKMGLGIEVEIKPPKDSTIEIDLRLDNPRFLIGERGQTLAEIQYLLKAVFKKQAVAESPFYVNLDINDYKKKKAEYLEEIARNAADEVALTKKEKKLHPMPAYERRIVHLALAPRKDVITESLGREPERYIVIKSYP